MYIYTASFLNPVFHTLLYTPTVNVPCRVFVYRLHLKQITTTVYGKHLGSAPRFDEQGFLCGVRRGDQPDTHHHRVGKMEIKAVVACCKRRWLAVPASNALELQR